MKKRHIIILAMLLGTLGVVLWHWPGPTRETTTPKAAKSATAATPEVAAAASPVPAVPPYTLTDGPDDEGTPVTTNSPVRSATVATRLLSTHPAASRIKVAALLSQLNDKDIDFYGKVVDQNGQAVPDVKVTGSAIYNSDRGSGVQEKHTATDAKGYFEFHGLKGRSFDYHLEKVGYETMPDGVGFDYTELVPENKRYHPDPKNPTILKMWKLQGAEPMIEAGRSVTLPVDGTSIRFDLLSGKQVEKGGDLIVLLKHDMLPKGTIPPQRNFDWTIQISAVDGGFVQSTQKLMYLAPETGYTPDIIVNMKADNPEWDLEFRTTAYLKSRNKIYSRIEFHLIVSQKLDAANRLAIGWHLNPSGSRNLEFDAKKQIPLSK